MGVRHVGGLRGVLAAAPVPTMRGDAPALEKQFDRGGAEADLDPLVHELVGDAVVVALDEDVVVDVHAGVAPLGEFVPARRKRAQQRTIELLEQRAARDTELAHRARVERREQFANGDVQLREAEEAAVAQHGQDPALGDEHVRLDDGFVARVAGACGDHGRAVVLGELEVGAIDDGLVAARLGDAAAEVIGDKDRRRAAEGTRPSARGH